MELDELLLKTMKHRDNYSRYSMVMKSPLLKSANLPHGTISDFGRWFRENPEEEVIDEKAFLLWSKLKHNMGDGEADFLVGEDLIKSRGEVPESLQDSLMDRLLIEIKSIELQGILEDYKRGEDIDLYSELRSTLDSMEADLNRKRSFDRVDVPIEELLNEHRNQDGVRWRLNSLNRSMRPLRPGDFIVIAARPDAGKTSFLSSELTFMSGQLPEGRPIIWLNNEGPGRRILSRVYQAALDSSMTELELLLKDGVLHSRYAEAIGGASQLKVFDVHDLMSHDIEDLIKEEKPGMIVFDMLDNIKFSGMNHHGGQRTDQILESMYQWARLLGVKYDCIVLATSQVSADGEGEKYPTQDMLKDTKTGKQGAADVILMIGKDKDDSNLRYLSTPKNKLSLPTCKNPYATATFDWARSRFHDDVKEIRTDYTQPVSSHSDDDDVPF